MTDDSRKKTAAGQEPEKQKKRPRPVAIVECDQEIPCNPCATICPKRAIRKEELYTRPLYDSTLCIGCSLCVSACPGLAIYLQIEDYDDEHSTITFPWEYEPRPKAGDIVEATDRSGRGLGPATVLSVTDPEKNNRTSLVTLLIPKALKDEIRFMKRLPRPVDTPQAAPDAANDKKTDETRLGRQTPAAGEKAAGDDDLPAEDDRLICRCEEITAGEIRRAVREGRHSVTAVKRATRAGMGACQGRTCARLIANILHEEGISGDSEDKTRYPIVPVAIAALEEAEHS